MKTATPKRSKQVDKLTTYAIWLACEDSAPELVYQTTDVDEVRDFQRAIERSEYDLRLPVLVDGKPVFVPPAEPMDGKWFDSPEALEAVAELQRDTFNVFDVCWANDGSVLSREFDLYHAVAAMLDTFTQGEPTGGVVIRKKAARLV